MSYTNEQVVACWQRNGGNVSATARELGLSRSTIQYHMEKSGAGRGKVLAHGRLTPEEVVQRGLPSRGVKRYICTSAQNNTHLHPKFWDNLNVLARDYKAEIFVSSFTYNINAYGKLAVKRNTFKGIGADLWYDERIVGLLDKSDANIELAPGLLWCGKSNTLPTAARPLSGLESYTGRKSGIFPHAKIAMESIASMKGEGTKFNYTTGAVTQLNYIQKSAGLKAEHHHSFGAMLVEVDKDGNWFCRQLNGDERGTIHDLDIKVEDGVLTRGNRVEAITWGDVHVSAADPDMLQLSWAPGGMVDVLRPKFQFFHDVLNFSSRNHHDLRNPHRMYELFQKGMDSVEDEVRQCADFLGFASRDFSKSVVVDSNHDNAMLRWLRETDWRDDMVNAEFYLEAQREVLKAIRESDGNFHTVEWALRRADASKAIRFLREDESFVICKDAHGGVECGIHGHYGLDGARGAPRQFAKMGRKANTAHTHKAGIIDGVYTAGCNCLDDQPYKKGPSAWSHSDIVTHVNGKRQIITKWAGKYRG